MSKVIHVRLSEQTIGYCYQLLENAGHEINACPMATAVSKALEALIAGAKTGGYVEYLDEDAAADIIQRALGSNDALADAFNNVQPFFRGAPPDAGDDILPPTGMQSLPDAIDNAVKDVLDGGVKAEAPTNLPEIIAEGPPHLTFDEIKKKAPLDSLVQQVSTMKEPQRKAMKRAISVVYANLSEDMWGGAKASSLVQDTLLVLGTK